MQGLKTILIIVAVLVFVLWLVVFFGKPVKKYYQNDGKQGYVRVGREWMTYEDYRRKYAEGMENQENQDGKRS